MTIVNRHGGRLGMLTSAEVAEMLGFHEHTILRWCRDGEIPFARKVGGRWFIGEVELAAHLRGKTIAKPRAARAATKRRQPRLEIPATSAHSTGGLRYDPVLRIIGERLSDPPTGSTKRRSERRGVGRLVLALLAEMSKHGEPAWVLLSELSDLSGWSEAVVTEALTLLQAFGRIELEESRRSDGLVRVTLIGDPAGVGT